MFALDIFNMFRDDIIKFDFSVDQEYRTFEDIFNGLQIFAYKISMFAYFYIQIISSETVFVEGWTFGYKYFKKWLNGTAFVKPFKIDDPKLYGNA